MNVRLVMVLAAAVSSAACAPRAAADPRPLVLASTTLFSDMAAHVAGDRMRVASIVPAGAPVEDYEPRPDDSQRVSKAALFLLNGLDLDRWAAPLLRDRAPDAPIVTLSDGLPTIEDNPHLWFDVSLGRRYVAKIRDALSAVDPSGRAIYTANAAHYDAELASLDDEVRATIAGIPAARRKLVTTHDAFPYFASAYGLDIVGAAQIEPGKETTPAELIALVKKVRSANVPVVFSEYGVSPRIAETIASETGARVVTDLPTDSILAAPADTYAGVIRTLALKIAQALR